MKNVLFAIWMNGKSLSVRIEHYRESTISEMRELGSNGDYLVLARYQDELYYLHPDTSPYCQLCRFLKPVHSVTINELDAVFAAYFEVRFLGNWFPCFMIGGNDSAVYVVADDPQNLSGLGSPHNYSMWGSGVAISQNQIEAVRLCLSDPIDPRLFAMA